MIFTNDCVKLKVLLGFVVVVLTVLVKNLSDVILKLSRALILKPEKIAEQWRHITLIPAHRRQRKEDL